VFQDVLIASDGRSSGAEAGTLFLPRATPSRRRRRDRKEGEEIRIPLSQEEVRAEKRPVVKEEITVGKRRVEDTETVRDTARRKEARVEETGDRARKPWKGKERRLRYDARYTGPDRRLVTT
jgi:hypothetical protein